MRSLHGFLIFAAALLASTPFTPVAHGQDVLYIGDSGDNTVKRFDAATGAALDAAGKPFVSGLAGPRGLLIDGSDLLVVNQDVNLQIDGEILVFNATTGAELPPLVPSTSKDAPFVPRGIILGYNRDLFVGDLSTASGTSSGELLRYDDTTGALISSSGPNGVPNNMYHPQGVVFGPDGLLYVTVRTLDKKASLGGAVLRYKADGTFVDTFILDAGGVGQLNRPFGLAFGPDGLLYVTSFRADSTDTDSIRIYDSDGDFVDAIDLAPGAGGVRAFAEALLFGPNGRLFVPITSTGEVRRYDVTSKTFDTFIEAGGPLLQPWLLTFGKTDPRTLAYKP
jgi:DNA-binding beta-propeller fold protein YncE